MVVFYPDQEDSANYQCIAVVKWEINAVSYPYSTLYLISFTLARLFFCYLVYGKCRPAAVSGSGRMTRVRKTRKLVPTEPAERASVPWTAGWSQAAVGPGRATDCRSFRCHLAMMSSFLKRECTDRRIFVHIDVVIVRRTNTSVWVEDTYFYPRVRNSDLKTFGYEYFSDGSRNGNSLLISRAAYFLMAYLNKNLPRKIFRVFLQKINRVPR